MKGDFSRLRFRPSKNYTSVLQQQGRVSLDADANEQCAIYDHLRTTETIDVVGLVGGPANDEGFKISVHGDMIEIGKGRYYVDGILCENEHHQQYSEQPFLIDPNPTDSELLSELSQGSISVIQVYLEVWRRLVIALDDPCLLEPALNHADTTARLQTVWRVVAETTSSVTQQATPRTNVAGLAGVAEKANLILASRNSDAVLTPPSTDFFDANAGILNIAAAPVATSNCCGSMDTGPITVRDPGKLSAQTGGGSGDCSCQPTPAAGYLGLENQLYRVEIHQAGNESKATFKWSRDNGSVVVAVTSTSGNQIYVDSLGPDTNLGFAVGQWVEVYDDSSLFGLKPNQPGDLYQIQVVTPGTLSVTVNQTVAWVDPTKNARMRRWDQVQSATSSGVPLTAGNPWINLENGIQVQFTAGEYTSGDYWLIPARTATGQIEWPPNDPCDCDGNDFRPAHRIEIWRAPLACIQWDGEQPIVYDCRTLFDNLVDLTKRPQGCCTVTVSPQDLTGSTTLQSIVDSAASPTMFVQAATPGSVGNNIAVQISNLKPNAKTPTFDLTAGEQDVYRGLTTGGSTGIEGIIGDEESTLPNTGPLAHILVGSVNTNLAPGNDQRVTFTGGATGTAAQANIMDSGNKKVVFTLQARSAGADGNLTHATISNLDTTQDPPTFDLTLTWSKALSGVSMATLLSKVQNSLGYVITAQAPATVSAVFPAAGITWLTGGVDSNPATGSNPATARAGIFGNPGKVCLRPGTYSLSTPLTLVADHSNMTLECCGGPATIAASAGWGRGEDFPQGLVVLNSANNVTLTGLRFSLPSPLKLVVGTSFLPGLALTQLEGILGAVVAGGDKEVATLLARLYVSVGLRPVGCCNLRVQNCCFDFTNYVGVDFPGTLLEAGILAGGQNSGLTLLDNHFQSQVNVISTSDGFFQIRVGYLLAHSVTISKLSRLADTRLGNSRLADSNLVKKGEGNDTEIKVHEEGAFLTALLDCASFQGNVFQGLEIPVLIFAECGAVALEDNTVENCYSGPWIFARGTPPDPTQLTGTPEAAQDTLQDPMMEGAIALAQCYPLPENLGGPPAVSIPSATTVLNNPPFQNRVLAFLNALVQLEVGLEQAAAEASSQGAQEGNSPSGPDLICHVVNNKIATYVLPEWADSTGPGLVIWGEDDDDNTEVIVNSNRFENASAPFVPTALIVQVESCVMTGNLVFNDNYSTVNGSLFLAPLGPMPPAPSIAVTGNLFNGNTNLVSLVTAAAQTGSTGNGTNTVFNFLLAQHPVQSSTVVIFTGSSQVGTDNGFGTITGTGLSGTIDYNSGATSLTFTTAPAAGMPITVSYYYAKWVPLNGP